MQYDLVGDIHGHAEALESLLEKLGYSFRGGAWRHPDRHMVFLGDLVDRGPDQLLAIDIARRMRDAGAGSVVMGNHEFNAIGFATAHRHDPARRLRSNNERNTHQHQAFLDAVDGDPGLHRELVAWFASLPLWLEFEGFRTVHACWHPDRIAALAPHVDAGNALTEEGLHAAFERDSIACDASEVILKGLEIPLPPGVSFFDQQRTERFKSRIAWWDAPETYRSAVAPLVDADTASRIPDEAIPESLRLVYDEAKPVFFGHYWMDGEPRLISDRKACLDFSIAKDGYLCAYRWDGERDLDASKLAWVRPGPEVTFQPTM